jgi:hypothetical protein
MTEIKSSNDTRRWRWTAAVLVAGAIAMSACGKSSGSDTKAADKATTSPTTATATKSSGDPCRLLTSDEAQAALGRAVGVPTKLNRPGQQYGTMSDCAYNATDQSAGPASVHVGILGESFPKDQWEQSEKAQSGYEPVAGVGELAFYSSNDNKIDVFDHGRWIQAQLINSKRASEQKALLTDIARNALKRV